MASTVLHYDHADFLKAMNLDLGPILGDLGKWCIKCMQDQAKISGNTELKSKFQVMHEIIEKYEETAMDVLSVEKKYNFMNKFCPKKKPEL